MSVCRYFGSLCFSLARYVVSGIPSFFAWFIAFRYSSLVILLLISLYSWALYSGLYCAIMFTLTFDRSMFCFIQFSIGIVQHSRWFGSTRCLISISSPFWFTILKFLVITSKYLGTFDSLSAHSFVPYLKSGSHRSMIPSSSFSASMLW